MEISEETMTNNHKYRNMNRRSRKLPDRHHHILIANSVPSEAIRGEKLEIITPHCHFVMKIMVPSLLAFATLKYQGNPKSLFVENPAPVLCFVISICVYCAIVDGMKQMRTMDNKYLLILNRAAFATGALSALSLVSILLLPHRLWVLPFFIWIPLLVVLAWPMLCGAYTWLHSQITTLFNIICAKLVSKEPSLPT